MTLTQLFTNIANAIRAKKGTSGTIIAENFPSEIASISTGIDTSDANAVANDIVTGKTAYVNNVKLTGTYTGIVPSGTVSITDNGTVDVSNYESANVNVSGGKNVQGNLGNGNICSCYGFSYIGSGLNLIVNKSGIYTVKWIAYKNASYDTFGTALYIDGSLYETANTTWGVEHIRNGESIGTNPSYQYNELTNVPLTAGQTVEIYAKSGKSSSGYVANIIGLVIEEE